MVGIFYGAVLLFLEENNVCLPPVLTAIIALRPANAISSLPIWETDGGFERWTKLHVKQKALFSMTFY